MQTLSPKKLAAIDYEGKLAAEHFRREGVSKASLYSLLERYYAVFDAMGEVLLPTADGPAPIACVKGCAFCCRTIVVVTEPEAFYFADHLAGAADGESLKARVIAADPRTRGLTGAERWRSGRPCPILDEQSLACSDYAGRPLGCRGVVSVSRERCAEAFQNRARGAGFDAGENFLFQNSDVYAYALAIGLKAAGRSLHRLELNAALVTIWNVAGAFERWLAGEDIFLDARAPNSTRPII